MHRSVEIKSLIIEDHTEGTNDFLAMHGQVFYSAYRFWATSSCTTFQKTAQTSQATIPMELRSNLQISQNAAPVHRNALWNETLLRDTFAQSLAKASPNGSALATYCGRVRTVANGLRTVANIEATDREQDSTPDHQS